MRAQPEQRAEPPPSVGNRKSGVRSGTDVLVNARFVSDLGVARAHTACADEPVAGFRDGSSS
jgi:hypothetical protein